MKNLLILLSIFAFFAFSCKKEKKQTDIKIMSDTLTVNDSLGRKLFYEKCMICHEHEGKTDTSMAAPPFYAIKRAYKKASMNKADFVETMSEWVKNPTEDKVLLKNALNNFEVMPYIPYSNEDISIIANYIYETDIPKPVWFDAHEAAHRRMGQGSMNADHSHN